MKNLRFHSCLLVSHKERSANQVEFHPRATVLKGGNDVGKSSIAKALYATLGASAGVESQKWKSGGVRTLLRFSVDDKNYEMLKANGLFTLFENGKVIGRHRNVTSGLGPQLAQILDFQLKLPNRQQSMVVTPPPAYLFLPFYCDQDRGWTQVWNSFANLQQFPDWKKEVVPFHTGMRDKGYYSGLETVHSARAAISGPKAEATALVEIRRRNESEALIDLDTDPAAFKEEVDALLAQLTLLSERRSEHRAKLAMLHEEKLKLSAQKDILEKVRRELHADYEFAVELPEDTVECPTCGQIHENSFGERFAIAQDEAKTADLFGEIVENLYEATRRIRAEEERFDSISVEHDKIQALLAKRQGQVTFGDVLRRQGTKEVSHQIDRRLSALQETIGSLEQQIAAGIQVMAEADAASRRRQINDAYLLAMARNLQALDLGGMDPTSYKRIAGPLHTTGSDLPRMLLAYMFSILGLVWDAKNSPLCPIVIDSPNQQDQEFLNELGMLEFIRDHRPASSQLIMCLVDDHGVDFGGTVVELQGPKYQFLRPDLYDKVVEQFAPYEEASLGVN